MRDFLASDRSPLPDQADGLRRIFAGARTRFVAEFIGSVNMFEGKQVVSYDSPKYMVLGRK